MNTEKELLLALLIEKYGTMQKAVQKSATLPVQVRHTKKRKAKKPRHSWSSEERVLLFHLKANGYTNGEILKNLRSNFPDGSFNIGSIANQYLDHLKRMQTQVQQ